MKSPTTFYCKVKLESGWSILLMALGIASMSRSADCASSCSLKPVHYEGDSFFKAVQSLSSDPQPLLDQGMPLTDSDLSFSPSRIETKYEHPAVDVHLTTVFDASSIRGGWESEIRSHVDDVGCSSQTSHSYRFDSITNAVLHGYFHIKYVNNSCGDWPWPFHGSWTFNNFIVETDVWHDFAVVKSDDKKHLSLYVSGHASNNVSQFERDAAKVIGNIFAIIPVTGSLVLGLDNKVFAGLKAERDAMDELAKVRLITTNSTELKNVPMDLLIQDASFTGTPDHPLISISLVSAEPLACSQAETLRESLVQQAVQGSNLGQDGTEYVVKRGDSAWNIAKQMYGDGNYYWIIDGANSISDSNADILIPGRRLHLPSLGNIFRGKNYVLVSRGDSFWALSRHVTDTPKPYTQFIKLNKSMIEDPDLIYPFQLLKNH
jgi:nucleoid-associated protein YgaU